MRPDSQRISGFAGPRINHQKCWDRHLLSIAETLGGDAVCSKPVSTHGKPPAHGFHSHEREFSSDCRGLCPLENPVESMVR